MGPLGAKAKACGGRLQRVGGVVGAEDFGRQVVHELLEVVLNHIKALTSKGPMGPFFEGGLTEWVQVPI